MHLDLLRRCLIMLPHDLASLQSEDSGFTYPAAQVDGEDGLFSLLQKEDHHEGEGVGRDAAFSLAVNVAQLQR